MATIEVEKGLAEQTVRDLHQARERLLKEKEAIDARIADLGERIAKWKSHLGETENGVPRARGPRRKKGHNLKDIVGLFEGLGPNAGMTMAEIAEKTRIPWSSVRNVLQKNENVFQEDTDGLWYYRKKSQIK